MKRKIDDLTEQLNDINNQFEQKQRLCKEDAQNEIKLLQAKYQQEKEILEQKCEARRKALKELEASTSRALTELEKEKAVQLEKLTAAEFKRSEIEKKYTCLLYTSPSPRDS
eukprot:TRINITY_DN17133_c0_g1_i2.p2 TRINITY_DN17133_c0_g1~~TRINITY_DN17133_c0_g1_i2.p2  ORF type:complete len:112 (-),score=43.06 TRINITY_DN17133_c0_g1_i2:38-373(-)